MNLWQFMSDSPVLTFLLSWMLIAGVVSIVRAIFGRKDPTTY